jgi:hypothetical protein
MTMTDTKSNRTFFSGFSFCIYIDNDEIENYVLVCVKTKALRKLIDSIIFFSENQLQLLRMQFHRRFTIYNPSLFILFLHCFFQSV